MRRVWLILGLPVATIIGALGCANQDAHLRPPKQPEAYNLPPENDPSYSQPIVYPKNSLFQDDPRKSGELDPAAAAGAGGRPPGAGGMGGGR
jgi:hypothetical protein